MVARSCPMTTATKQQRLTFALKLRQAIDQKGVSVRSLGRTLNPLSPETGRSNLMRWLRGAHRPSRTSRRAVAVALGMPGDYFDDDDEEADPALALYQIVRRIVREEAERLVH